MFLVKKKTFFSTYPGEARNLGRLEAADPSLFFERSLNYATPRNRGPHRRGLIATMPL